MCPLFCSKSRKPNHEPIPTRLCERSEALSLAKPQARDRRAYRLAKTKTQSRTRTQTRHCERSEAISLAKPQSRKLNQRKNRQEHPAHKTSPTERKGQPLMMF